ncbi:MAG: tRNA (adenosine(37)-N6)-dimethylallyltransferase MiaA [Rickettsiaceae bacterium]|nr:tRNA (adenosine(37)-N6)-dimethylallyltransferase MiaA [Rickettsiaceae bacterium]MDP4832930.1 tRNA (adenosine(37)-N6)-dimethylallyltransferase MiaA [Rickettsiaceae bacterium]MDP5020747.1 tRNA (adenosine(37)-N6)-dimethylallyltransferase MiaA [Rickettsiaceae bacterium]MDP5083470.1 tRNA (adenosine(37)-N6)-dimethylallyltransferase MiaA [Rickettsiaceae bacterium]
MSNNAHRAIIICGPTASGKTEFAHQIALKNHGEIVNADSMQLYKQLPIITASPAASLQKELPYHLYNFQNVDKEFSAAKYVNAASKMVTQITERNKLPIIVGGSGMYINMLVNGYSAIPNIEDDIRTEARKLHTKIGADAFFQNLQILDPQITTILNIGDTQRIIRAYEVVVQTGQSILNFQAQDNIMPLPNFSFDIFCLLPERKFLYKTCNTRLIKLFDAGAIEEVKDLYKNYGDLQTSAMKALGVAEIISYIKGNITRQDAIDLASTRTRQYAKRQITWFKNQLPNTKIIKFNNLEEYKLLMTSFTLHSYTN